MAFRMRIKKEIFRFAIERDFSGAVLIKILSAIAIAILVTTVPGWIMLVEARGTYVSLREIGIYLLNTVLFLLLIPFFALAKQPVILEKISLKTKGKTLPTSRFVASISLLSLTVALIAYLAIVISGLT